MSRRIAVSLLLLAPLALAPGAAAKTINAKSVLSVDGKISCYGTMPAEGRTIFCSTPALGRKNGVTRFLRLSATGTSSVVARSDYGGYDERPKTIRIGDRWNWRGIACNWGSMGLNCNNADDHGFLISNRSVDRH